MHNILERSNEGIIDNRIESVISDFPMAIEEPIITEQAF
jgi:hypothetical protein